MKHILKKKASVLDDAQFFQKSIILTGSLNCSLHFDWQENSSAAAKATPKTKMAAATSFEFLWNIINFCLFPSMRIFTLLSLFCKWDFLEHNSFIMKGLQKSFQFHWRFNLLATLFSITLLYLPKKESRNLEPIKCSY